MEIKENEFVDWKHHPITTKIFQYLKDQREEIKEDIVLGKYTYPDAESTAIKHASCIGECMALKEITEITWTDIDNFYSPGIEEIEEKQALEEKQAIESLEEDTD